MSRKNGFVTRACCLPCHHASITGCVQIGKTIEKMMPQHREVALMAMFWMNENPGLKATIRCFRTYRKHDWTCSRHVATRQSTPQQGLAVPAAQRSEEMSRKSQDERWKLQVVGRRPERTLSARPPNPTSQLIHERDWTCVKSRSTPIRSIQPVASTIRRRRSSSKNDRANQTLTCRKDHASGRLADSSSKIAEQFWNHNANDAFPCWKYLNKHKWVTKTARTMKCKRVRETKKRT